MVIKWYFINGDQCWWYHLWFIHENNLYHMVWVTVPAMMTESVLGGPNLSVISCLCLWTARWSSLVNLYKRDRRTDGLPDKSDQKKRAMHSKTSGQKHFQRKKREWYSQDLSLGVDNVGQRETFIMNYRLSLNLCTAHGRHCSYTSPAHCTWQKHTVKTLIGFTTDLVPFYTL